MKNGKSGSVPKRIQQFSCWKCLSMVNSTWLITKNIGLMILSNGTPVVRRSNHDRFPTIVTGVVAVVSSSQEPWTWSLVLGCSMCCFCSWCLLQSVFCGFPSSRTALTGGAIPCVRSQVPWLSGASVGGRQWRDDQFCPGSLFAEERPRTESEIEAMISALPSEQQDGLGRVKWKKWWTLRIGA